MKEMSKVGGRWVGGGWEVGGRWGLIGNNSQ